MRIDPREIWMEPSLFIFFQAAADGLSCTSNRPGNCFLGETEFIRSGVSSFIQKKGSNALRKREKESPLDPGDHIRKMFGCQFVDEIFQIDIIFINLEKVQPGGAVGHSLSLHRSEHQK